MTSLFVTDAFNSALKDLPGRTLIKNVYSPARAFMEVNCNGVCAICLRGSGDDISPNVPLVLQTLSYGGHIGGQVNTRAVEWR